MRCRGRRSKEIRKCIVININPVQVNGCVDSIRGCKVRFVAHRSINRSTTSRRERSNRRRVHAESGCVAVQYRTDGHSTLRIGLTDNALRVGLTDKGRSSRLVFIHDKSVTPENNVFEINILISRRPDNHNICFGAGIAHTERQHFDGVTSKVVPVESEKRCADIVGEINVKVIQCPRLSLPDGVDRILPLEHQCVIARSNGNPLENITAAKIMS